MLKLDVAPTFDFDLIGIVSNERGFKLAWLLNHVLGISMRRMPDVTLDFHKGEYATFVLFQYLTTNDGYQMLRNKAIDTSLQKPFLLPELPDYDYLLKIENNTGTIDIAAVQNKIANLTEVQYCSLLQPKSLKHRDNLLF